jgi:hypothetical protein
MVPSKDDPLRPPDWRWQRARWMRENNKYARKGREDEETMVVKRYQTAKAACHTDLELERVKRKFPGLFHAEEFHDREDLDYRWELEARLLARESFEDIANKAGINEDLVYWYERTFYNVTDRIDNRTYICQVAMGRSIHKGLFERDYDLLWKMLGYGLGPTVVDSLTSRLTNPQRVTSADQVDAAFHAQTESAITAKSLTAILTMPVSYNQAVIVDFFLKMKEIQKNAGGGVDVHNQLLLNINAALTSLPFSTERPTVASPQLGYYDDQSAELRSDEMLAIGLGFDSPALREAVKVTFPGAKDGDNAANQ